MTAFTQAWTFLKADPESLGAHRVTLPPPIMGMMNRLREQGKLGQRGDISHQQMQVMNPMQQGLRELGQGGVHHTGEYPIEVGEGEGDRIPIDPAEIERDMSPLRENMTTMMNRNPLFIQQDAEGNELAMRRDGSRVKGGDDEYATEKIRGYKTNPEESFYSPQEQYAINPEFARVTGRNILGAFGGKDGTVMQTLRGGSGAGLYSPSGMHQRRRATGLGNVEGMAQNTRINQRSSTDTKARNEAMKELQLRQLIRDNPNMSAGQILEARKKMDEEVFTPDYEALQDEFTQMGADFDLPPPPAPPQQIFNPIEQMRAEQLSPFGARAQARLEQSKGPSGEEFRAGTQDPEIDPRLYEMMQMRSGDDMKQRLQELGMDDMSTSKRIGEAAREKMQAMRDEDMLRRIAQLQREQARPSQTQSDIDEQG